MLGTWAMSGSDRSIAGCALVFRVRACFCEFATQTARERVRELREWLARRQSKREEAGA